MDTTHNTGGVDIAEMMRTYGNDVLRTAYSYVKDRDVAEDIFQDVFIKAYYNMDKFRGDSSLKTWLIRITINCCKDYLKSAYQKKVVPLTDFEEDSLPTDGGYEAVENADRDAQVKRAVMTLPEQYRSVVMCVYYEELSVEEAAKALGLPPGTVKSRLFRARDMLKKKLEGRLD